MIRFEASENEGRSFGSCCHPSYEKHVNNNCRICENWTFMRVASISTPRALAEYSGRVGRMPPTAPNRTWKSILSSFRSENGYHKPNVRNKEKKINVVKENLSVLPSENSSEQLPNNNGDRVHITKVIFSENWSFQMNRREKPRFWPVIALVHLGCTMSECSTDIFKCASNRFISDKTRQPKIANFEIPPKKEFWIKI